MAHEDYLKAGYRMLPFQAGRSEASARQILIYTMLCIPASLLPWALPGNAPMVGDAAFVVAILAGTRIFASLPIDFGAISMSKTHVN